MNMRKIHITAFSLLIIGGLNWLLVGLFEYNLVADLFDNSVVAKLIYIFVGLAALFELFAHKQACKVCVTAHKEEKDDQSIEIEEEPAS